jgi:FkbM family methyltransferase
MFNELVGRRGAHEYHLRSHDAVAVMRHNHYDAHILHENVRDPFYTPPPPVQAALSGGDQPSIVDLGGNVGFFGLLFLGLYPHARVVSFEPDLANVAILKRNIERNGYGDRWTVVEACAGAVDGETPFVGGQAALSRMPLPGDPTGDAPTTTVPVVDVFPHLSGVDVLKIDIEGGEWALLGDQRFADARPPAVLLEWHSYDCPEDNPRRAAAARLEGLGYTVLHEKPAPVPDTEPLYGAGTLWAWRGESI